MSTETITTSRGQEEEKGEEADDPSKTMENLTAAEICRKEKRKMLKKLKRKQIRKEIAIKERAEEELRLEDPEEQRKLMLKEQEEAEMIERQRKDFEERERLWMERVAQKAQEEEEARRKIIEEQKEDEVHQKQIENENDTNGDDNAWEYVEEGPVEIIWQGNEIIVKKKTVRVAKRNSKEQACVEDANRPTSNPLPPQSEAFSSYKNTSISSKQVFESVSSQTPNFGTEQDKANCPFHIKTGACRFGSRCSRVHFYPDKSCTLLIKNMYSGPGLAWEQDEGLEKLQHTDEEVERCYEEFYADVHDEFAKFGEIVNFKVCRNGSFHLRGNVYVHYKCLESAMDAYHSTNGRYYACKQITCEYVGVTRWKVAICGEYMKSRFKTCSRGTACNFIHCFRNPCGDYEWADSDKPPPRYWVKRMAAIFGPSDEVGHDKQLGSKTPDQHRNPRKKTTPKSERYHSRRSRSRDIDYRSNSSDEDNSDENRGLSHRRSRRHKQNTGSRYMKSPSDDHASREYYAEDKERPDKYSRAHSTYSSKWEDRPYNHDNAEKKYANNVSEHAEGKDRVHTDDYPRKYHDRVESKDYSSRQDHKTGREKADVDKHVKSEECYNSQHVEKKYANNASEHAEVKDRVQVDDSSRNYHDRVESRDHSSRHRKTGMKKKADLDENVKSEECYNSQHLEKKYANHASEHAEEKNRVQIDDSSRKYNDRVEGRDHSSGLDRKTGIEKKADLDEHMKSGECNNSRHVEKEYTNNVSEDVEEKVRLRNDDSPRKYCDRLESRDHSSRQDHKSRMEKAADLDSRKDRKTRMAEKSDLDEHVKSVELYNSEDVEKKYANKAAEHAEEIDRVRTDDSPRKYSDKVESGDHSSRQDRKTSRREKKADLDVHVKSEECYNSRDSDSRPSSEHHRRKHRSRPSRRVQSKNLEVEGGSSSEDQHSEGNLKDYHKKHRSRGRKQHRRHYKETSSSGESGEESSLERDDSRHNSETRISSRSRKEQDSHRRRKHYTKKKDENTDEDKKSKRKRTSRKRSRSRSPVQSSSKAKRATPSDS